MSKFLSPFTSKRITLNDSPVDSPVSLLFTWVSWQHRPLALRTSPTFPSFAASPLKNRRVMRAVSHYISKHLKFRTWCMLHGDVELQPPHRLRRPVATSLYHQLPTISVISWYLWKHGLSWDNFYEESLHKSSPKKVPRFLGTTFVRCFLLLGQHTFTQYEMISHDIPSSI